jgi:hypothetical protein
MICVNQRNLRDFFYVPLITQIIADYLLSPIHRFPHSPLLSYLPVILSVAT